MIEKWFPIQGVHFIGGPSGVGKSRWLLKIIEAWQRGETIFGHNSTPLPFAYITADRGRRDAFATMYDMGLDPNKWPIIAHNDVMAIETAEQIIKRSQKYFPKAKVFFIEGIASLMPSSGAGDPATNNRAVQKFLKSLSIFNEKNDSTIIGTVHTAKAKKDAEYSMTREKILGAVAWGGYGNTIINVAQVNPDDPKDKERIITVLPRNGAPEQYSLVFNSSGLLERTESKEEIASSSERAFKQFRASLTNDNQEFVLNDLVSFLGALKPPQSLSTAQRSLKSAISNGQVIKIQHGKYAFKEPDLLDVHLNQDDTSKK